MLQSIVMWIGTRKPLVEVRAQSSNIGGLKLGIMASEPQTEHHHNRKITDFLEPASFDLGYPSRIQHINCQFGFNTAVFPKTF